MNLDKQLTLLTKLKQVNPKDFCDLCKKNNKKAALIAIDICKENEC